jgi:formiminotetrahydrofolate cyclodeaminase
MYSHFPVKRYLRCLASAEPYPGGGSASCLVASAGISLALMVAGILEKKKIEPRLRSALRELGAVNRAAIRAIDGDVKAYQKVVRAYAVEKGRKGRERRIETSLKGGYEFQKNFAGTLLRAVRQVREIEREARGSIASDLVLSRHFLRAGFLGALQTARVNLEYLKDERFKKEGFAVLESLGRKFNGEERS